MTERDRLADRFLSREANGLLDVRFDLAPGATSLEKVCKELNALYSAVDAGHEQALDFGDSQR